MMPILGIVGSVGGMFMNMMGQSAQAEYQEGVARNNAIIQKQKANEEAAIGQREQIAETKKADLVASRAQALGAASGTARASPTQVDIESSIAAQGSSNALSALYDGMVRSRDANYQADIELFKADNIASASSLNMMGSLFSGISSIGGGLAKSGMFDTAGASATSSPSDLSGASGMPSTFDLAGTGGTLLPDYRQRRRSMGFDWVGAFK
jgi:hypothetical protein